jgi:prepilin-type processing-associated H-X9-DG protein
VLNDQNAASLSFLTTRDATRIPVISDKENFHRYQGIEVNILFADGAVKKDVMFSVNK